MNEEELRGKTVLVEIACHDLGGRPVDVFEVYGRVESVSEIGIRIRRGNWAELYGLPPDPGVFEPAPEGDYALRSTGEAIERPDYVAALTVTVSDPEALLQLRGLGFVPSGR
jgi:hypothetical protein